MRITLHNGDFLEAAEFFRLTPDGIQVVDYRHQWMDGSRTHLRMRWDSTPHHPELDNAPSDWHRPHHCHEGCETKVFPSYALSIQDVLDVIARELLDES